LIVQQKTVGTVCHAIDVLNHEGLRTHKAKHPVKVAIQVVNRISGISASALRKALTRIATDKKIGVRKGRKFCYVTRFDSSAEVVFVRTTRHFRYVVGPYDAVTCSGQSKVRTSATAEERYGFYRPPCRSRPITGFLAVQYILAKSRIAEHRDVT
jgi:hypothetical protein